MEHRYESEELDEDTLEYLREARDQEGQGMPGVFLDAKTARLTMAYMPIVAGVCGPVILLLTFFLTWGSLRNPTSVALLMTGGFFLGGWLLLAAFRCLFAQQRSDYLGHFKYIDPLYIWHATGTGVWVTPIEMLLDSDVQHHCDQSGNYSYSTLHLRLADRKLDLDVRGEEEALQVNEYFLALSESPTGTPTERGFEARRQAIEDEEEPVVDAIPRPKRERTPRGMLALVFLPVVALVLFVGCRWLAVRGRDDALFEAVKTKQVPELRFYLIDSRNTRHRSQVEKLLQGHHELTALRVNGQGDPELAAGLAELVRSVATEARPVITLGVAKSEKKTPEVPSGYLSPAVLETLNRQLIKDLSDRLAPHLGQQTADYAEVQDGHAMVEITPKVTIPVKDPGVARDVRIDWTVTMQPAPEAPKRSVTITTKAPLTTDEPAPQLFGQLYQQMPNAFQQRVTQARQ